MLYPSLTIAAYVIAAAFSGWKGGRKGGVTATVMSLIAVTLMFSLPVSQLAWIAAASIVSCAVTTRIPPFRKRLRPENDDRVTTERTQRLTAELHAAEKEAQRLEAEAELREREAAAE